MAYTTADLAAIDAAIASGELSVEHSGKKVVYRSVGELMQARGHIASQLAAQASSLPASSSLVEFVRD